MTCEFQCGAEPMPSNALNIGYQDDSGEYAVAVANTEWGRIPGKARGNTCWYSYGGSEHCTEDFDWVKTPCTMSTVANTGSGPPPGARPLGQQHDRGDVYAVIAHSEWGKIAGKAGPDTCAWFPYGGQEHETDDFEWVVCTRLGDHHHGQMDVELVCGNEGPKGYPEHGLAFGDQNDGGGDHCVAVAETEHGTIPGKAKDGNCYYSFNGGEHRADEFKYVVQCSPHTLVSNHDTDGPPHGALEVGHQNDGGGAQYAVIAHTEYGRIPGKAHDKECAYPYGGGEHVTHDFEWVCIPHS